MSVVHLTTHSVDETRNLGAAFATLLPPGTVVVLSGGLGAGKTAFAQGMAKGLGVTERVTSPTFTLLATHEASGRNGIHSFLHADLYRVSSGAEVEDLAIGELVEDGAVAAVEWGDLAPDVFGPNRVVVELSLGKADDDRQISMTSDVIDLERFATAPNEGAAS